MTPERIAEVVAQINAIDRDDPEAAHATVDDLLEELTPPEINQAINKLVSECAWWAFG